MHHNLFEHITSCVFTSLSVKKIKPPDVCLVFGKTYFDEVRLRLNSNSSVLE